MFKNCGCPPGEACVWPISDASSTLQFLNHQRVITLPGARDKIGSWVQWCENAWIPKIKFLQCKRGLCHIYSLIHSLLFVSSLSVLLRLEHDEDCLVSIHQSLPNKRKEEFGIRVRRTIIISPLSGWKLSQNIAAGIFWPGCSQY